uniref:Protein kinase domain-containing protein n=1 Tax=Macrostomum lignano TaxID=282301 RepID=A0A1I8JCR3_9PLAT
MQQSIMDSSEGRNKYLAVINTCNTVLYNLSKNLWSKHFPEETKDAANLNLQFDIESGDSTPRKLVSCLAKQVHNVKCVAKILERVKEAEKQLRSLEDSDEEDENNKDNQLKSTSAVDNLSKLIILSNKIALLAKCSAAMQRRHSIRHRVLPVEPGRVACHAVCDMDCPVLGISLSQQGAYLLLENNNRQQWVIEDARTGLKQRVPPLLLALAPDSAELGRIRRIAAGFERAAGELLDELAGPLMERLKSLRASRDELTELPNLATEDAINSFLYRLQIVEKFLKSLQSSANRDEALNDFRQCKKLVEAIDFLLGNIQADSVDIHRYTVAKNPDLFEFEFEFLETTRKRSTSSSRQRRSASVSDLASPGAGPRFSSEMVTRQRQEVAKKYVIQSVWNGRCEVSLQDAIASGVVNFQRGIYTELLGSRAEMPLEAAMSAGKIRVELVTAQQVSEDASSFGLISIENPEKSSTSEPGGSAKTSYVVHAVVDVAAKEKLGFQEAAQKGLIDRETGAFTNSATGEVLPPAEAISKGFFKAYPVEDTRSLNIDPENRISVTHLNKLRSRWGAVNAFAKNRKTSDGK